MKIEGDRELIKALKEIPDKLARKTLRTVGTKAARPVAAEARKLVKPVSPTIAKSIAIKAKVYPKSGNLFVAIGPRRDSPKSPTGHNPSKTAHLVDRGTKPHDISRGWVRIKHPGARATPFLQPAEKKAQAEVERIFLKELSEGLTKILKGIK